MEPIASLLPSATGEPSPSPTTTPAEPLPPTWKAAFSERMRSLFRQAWTSQWSTPAEYERLLADYAAMLARLTPEQIRAGLDDCVGRTYPPNPSEFYGMATKTEPAPSAAHKPFKALPRPPRDPAKTAERFAAVRAALHQNAA